MSLLVEKVIIKDRAIGGNKRAKIGHCLGVLLLHTNKTHESEIKGRIDGLGGWLAYDLMRMTAMCPKKVQPPDALPR